MTLTQTLTVPLTLPLTVPLSLTLSLILRLTGRTRSCLSAIRSRSSDACRLGFLTFDPRAAP